MKQPIVYMITNKPNGVLYISVTSNLQSRMAQHQQKLVTGFSAKYGLEKLVYFEVHQEMYAAITREKQLKKWSKAKKEALINNEFEKLPNLSKKNFNN